jgi:hypothetical protein
MLCVTYVCVGLIRCNQRDGSDGWVREGVRQASTKQEKAVDLQHGTRAVGDSPFSHQRPLSKVKILHSKTLSLISCTVCYCINSV